MIRALPAYFENFNVSTGDWDIFLVSPGTGEGGDWWSWPMGVKAKGMLRVCQGESSNSRIP